VEEAGAAAGPCLRFALNARPSGLAERSSGSGRSTGINGLQKKRQGDTSNELTQGTFLEWVDIWYPWALTAGARRHILHRMKLIYITLLSSMLAVTCLLLQPQPVVAAGAQVVDGPCGVTWNGSLYQGDGHWVRTPNGSINGHCHATLVSGPGESETIHISFIGNTPWGLTPHDGVITSSGVLDVDTHN
jgi:hypothetical protein